MHDPPMKYDPDTDIRIFFVFGMTLIVAAVGYCLWSYATQ